MERDILHKLGNSLTASLPTGKTIGFISDLSTEQNIIKWILKKYRHLCTRLGPSKIIWQNQHSKEISFPQNIGAGEYPCTLLERVAKISKKIDDRSPKVITVEKDKSVKIALDSEEINDSIH